MSASSVSVNGNSSRPRRKAGSRPLGRGNRKKEKKVSRLRKPSGLTLEEWQIVLRRQYGAAQDFELKNLGKHPFYSEFRVFNPQSKNAYRVQIRGDSLGENYCSCPDFATNTLGTCKHIEFTLAKLHTRRGAKRAFSEGFQPEYSEVFLHYGAEREVHFRPGENCPTELARLAAKYFDTDGRLREKSFGNFSKFGSRAVELEPELRVYSDVLEFVAEVCDIGRRKRRLSEIFPDGIRSAAFDGLLSLPLYDYQREGALFAAGAGRCLIGDEMGLGKTIQALAAVEIMHRCFGVERVLIVCPTSLKHQWENEVARFIGRSARSISGSRTARERSFEEESFFKITNYDTVHTDLDLISAWSPDLVILDEAQRIKNWETRTAKCVKKIASPYAIVLTGTPIENRLEELVSIVQFVDIHRFGPTSMRKLLSRPEQDEHGTIQTSIRHHPLLRSAMKRNTVAPIHTGGVAMRHVGPRDAT